MFKFSSELEFPNHLTPIPILLVIINLGSIVLWSRRLLCHNCSN